MPVLQTLSSKIATVLDYGVGDNIQGIARFRQLRHLQRTITATWYREDMAFHGGKLFVKSYSQMRQDIFVLNQLNDITSGTFLDIGCGEPFTISNTAALEQLGWRGLLVDLSPQKCLLCRKQRKNPVIEGDAVQLNWSKVCKEYGLGKEIDYLSLDIDDQPGEKSKTLYVLRRLVNSGFSFRVLTIEHDSYRLGNGPKNRIREFMFSHSYELSADQECNWEDWWVRKINC